MCSDCLKEEYPDRESVCLDSGSFMMNYSGCAKCGENSQISSVNRQTSEEDGEETITYQHVCTTCNHFIANHEHTFSVEDDYQVYQMYCMLCGRAEDQRSILPYDPRGPRNDCADCD